ncbi:stage II sporulation protein P [Sporomusa malonica]|uniref:Stage II sporulation protein P n=1 Tax=Sporomusa malonica TaxID=112901 RepID=A0A1W2A975_9FIRM|nr:stage II sporulation protein P [Sporomusa malonica]SMC57206.1 stage II sporulation protein P [Sporomusa malonica]
MKSRLLVTILVGLLLVTTNILVLANERNDGSYSTIVDEGGNTVYMTGWRVQAGDQVITENNRRYEVVRVDGDTAHAKFIGEVNLSLYYQDADKSVLARLRGLLEPTIARAEGGGKVAIYHTHSDESYVPTDGKESILGAGGIYKVGAKFSESLKSKGINVAFSEAKHDPHDDMAYERSRRTALNLIKKEQPDAVFDLHRDAVPPQVYKGNIDGQDVSKIQLVVGKYGPTGKQIEDYAIQIKAASDKKHPGLVKGIFFAKGGDYNQDLHPRSMLLEVGAHTNDRESAEKGIALFSDVVPTVLGKSSAPTGPNAAGTTGADGNTGLGSAAGGASGATKSMGWIVGLLIVGTAAFLFLSTGSMKEAGAKLKNFASTEFANFLGPKTRKRRKNPSDSEQSEKQDDNK